MIPRLVSVTQLRQSLARVEEAVEERVEELPSPRRVAMSTRRLLRLMAHAVADETVSAVVKLFHPMTRLDFERVEAETVAAAEQFEHAGWLEEPRTYHRDPPPLTTEPGSRPARFLGLHYEHLRFPSCYAPHPDEPGAARWSSYAANRTVHVRMLRHDDEPRPWIVCVHGTGMGWAVTDFLAFRAAHLHVEAGLNVAMPVLPLSGPRRRRGFDIQFPTNDNLDNVHGLAQSVWDLRRLLSWIRRQPGGDDVGIQGVSLGGYVAALYSAFDPDLRCVIAGVPAADFPQMFTRHMPAHIEHRYPDMVRESSTVHRVVSPLTLPPAVPPECRFVYGGLADRMVDPIEQVRELWLYWDRPSVHWYDGSHLGFGSDGVLGFVRESLARAGISAARRDPAESDDDTDQTLGEPSPR